MLAMLGVPGRRAFSTRINLLVEPSMTWVVPPTLTMLNVFAAARGGAAAANSTTGAHAGGGGAAILNVPLAVTPGDTLTVTQTLTGSLLQSVVTVNGQNAFWLETGEAGITGSRGGRGGSAAWLVGGATYANGGAGQTQGGVPAGNGEQAAVAGGTLLGGGGGGAGGALFPVTAGGKGGDSGNFAGILDGSVAGGGGGGYLPGQYVRNNTTPTDQGTTVIFVEY